MAVKALGLALALILGASGCVSTELSTPEGLVVKRTAFWSDFAIHAERGADGSLSVDETQSGGELQPIIDLLVRAARKPD